MGRARIPCSHDIGLDTSTGHGAITVQMHVAPSSPGMTALSLLARRTLSELITPRNDRQSVPSLRLLQQVKVKGAPRGSSFSRATPSGSKFQPTRTSARAARSRRKVLRTGAAGPDGPANVLDRWWSSRRIHSHMTIIELLRSVVWPGTLPPFLRRPSSRSHSPPRGPRDLGAIAGSCGSRHQWPQAPGAAVSQG